VTVNPEYLRRARDLVSVSPVVYQTLFMKVGEALWHVQHFEYSMAYYLATVLDLSKADAAQRTWELVDSTRKKTSGELLKRLRVKGVLSPEGDAALTELIRERNWLVHRLQEEDGDAVFGDETLSGLLLRIERLRKTALGAQKEFARLVLEWTKRQGVSQEQIDEVSLLELSRKRKKISCTKS